MVLRRRISRLPVIRVMLLARTTKSSSRTFKRWWVTEMVPPFCYAEMGFQLNEEQNTSVEVSTENGPVETSNSAVDGDGQAIDYKAEYRKWKALSRKNEEAYKKTAAELEKLRQASMSEAERAIEQARQEARNATLQEFGARDRKSVV